MHMSFVPDTQNKEFQDALNLIQYTRQSVFLTGKAGTGKSTFLRYICEHTKKKHVVKVSLTDHYGPAVLLAVMFVITNLFTELITNNAAAALAFPLALSISSQLGVSPTPFFVVICMAASASFSTPIGYQTNLIVQGIGNYKFTDFVRIGLPLNIITFLISIFLIPLIWPF